MTGLRLECVVDDLSSFVAGCRLDDDARVLPRYEGGARRMLWCSAVAPGCENGLRLRVFGGKGGLEWLQAELDMLHLAPMSQTTRRRTRGMPGLAEATGRAKRIPADHLEGYLEAFAQIYSDAASLIRCWLAGMPSGDECLLPPGILAACAT